LHDDIDERYINDKPVFFFKSELKKNQKWKHTEDSAKAQDERRRNPQK
jgi:hypothetical protein